MDEKEFKIIVDKNGKTYKKILPKKKSINYEINKIIAETNTIKILKSDVSTLEELSEKAVYYKG